MEEIDDPDLAVYVVWSTQLGAEAKHVPEAAELMPDRRALHYWDPGDRVGAVFQPVADLSSPAWDFWMLFDREARWTEGSPPDPAWWEHQLRGLPGERRLDAERFAGKAAKLLENDR